jgi:hypothetical protein
MSSLAILRTIFRVDECDGRRSTTVVLVHFNSGIEGLNELVNQLWVQSDEIGRLARLATPGAGGVPLLFLGRGHKGTVFWGSIGP